VIRTLLQRLHGVPPRQLTVRVLRRLKREVGNIPSRLRDRHTCTHPRVGAGPPALFRYLPAAEPGVLLPWKDEITALAALYREHRFDLLGSGWVRVVHGMRCRGLEGIRYEPHSGVEADASGEWLSARLRSAHRGGARRVWALVDPGYQPIDWQLDFKSGYRWAESTWFRDVRFGGIPGVDVKVPWELARMQHLPVLAWAHALARGGAAGLEPAGVYAREFRNQVLDFIATNPPRFGVNWVTAMDVGIRAANWLAAYDLFRAHGAVFDAAFEVEFARSIHAHGAHVAANLEWLPELRGNHYLADVVSLLFVAAYLPRSAATDAWLAFAVQELLVEVEQQFTTDGANFEASTSYHRLSAEMVVYGTALVLGLPAEKRAALRDYDAGVLRTTPPLRPAPSPLVVDAEEEGGVSFPTAYVERLARMAEFTVHMTKPCGRVAQVGDNDSGRFLKLRPVHRRITVARARERYANLHDYHDLPDRAIYWDEDHLDHRHLVAAVAGLLDREDFAAFAGAHVETALLHSLASLSGCRTRVPGVRWGAAGARVGTAETWHSVREKLASTSGAGAVRAFYELPVGALERLDLCAYPDFGLYLFRSLGLYLAVRCGDVGQRGFGGHAHNDQLMLELTIAGRDRIRDPGTYVYTPLPASRDAYRSAAAHAAPRVAGREPGRLDLGLFRLGGEGRGTCLYFGARGFIGMHTGYGEPVYRVIELHDEGISVNDYGPGITAAGTSPPFSPGYGQRHV
jgi:hypothetical protein